MRLHVEMAAFKPLIVAIKLSIPCEKELNKKELRKSVRTQTLPTSPMYRCSKERSKPGHLAIRGLQSGPADSS